MPSGDNLSAGLDAEFGVVSNRDLPVVASFGYKASDCARVPFSLTAEITTHRKLMGLHHNSLYTMIVRVEHVNPAAAIDGKRPRVVQHAGLSTTSSPTAERFSLLGKFLYTVVAILTNINMPLLVESKVIRVIELARIRTCLPPHLQELSLVIKDLNAMIAGVGNPQLSSLIEHDVLWPEELSWCGPMPPPLQEKVSVG